MATAVPQPAALAAALPSSQSNGNGIPPSSSSPSTATAAASNHQERKSSSTSPQILIPANLTGGPISRDRQQSVRSTVGFRSSHSVNEVLPNKSEVDETDSLPRRHSTCLLTPDPVATTVKVTPTMPVTTTITTTASVTSTSCSSSSTLELPRPRVSISETEVTSYDQGEKTYL